MARTTTDDARPGAAPRRTADSDVDALAQALEPERPPPQPADASLAGRAGILLVDDSPAVRSLLGDILRRHGFAVWTAASGSRAVDLYRRLSEQIALVLLDQRMPGLDGLQTMDCLRRLNPHLRCCFLTGTSEDDAQLLERGAETVLHKPMEPDDIARALWRILVTAPATSSGPPSP